MAFDTRRSSVVSSTADESAYSTYSDEDADFGYADSYDDDEDAADADAFLFDDDFSFLSLPSRASRNDRKVSRKKRRQRSRTTVAENFNTSEHNSNSLNPQNSSSNNSSAVDARLAASSASRHSRNPSSASNSSQLLARPRSRTVATSASSSASFRRQSSVVDLATHHHSGGAAANNETPRSDPNATTTRLRGDSVTQEETESWRSHWTPQEDETLVHVTECSYWLDRGIGDEVAPSSSSSTQTSSSLASFRRSFRDFFMRRRRNSAVATGNPHPEDSQNQTTAEKSTSHLSVPSTAQEPPGHSRTPTPKDDPISRGSTPDKSTGQRQSSLKRQRRRGFPFAKRQRVRSGVMFVSTHALYFIEYQVGKFVKTRLQLDIRLDSIVTLTKGESSSFQSILVITEHEQQQEAAETREDGSNPEAASTTPRSSPSTVKASFYFDGFPFRDDTHALISESTRRAKRRAQRQNGGSQRNVLVLGSEQPFGDDLDGDSPECSHCHHHVDELLEQQNGPTMSLHRCHKCSEIFCEQCLHSQYVSDYPFPIRTCVGCSDETDLDSTVHTTVEQSQRSELDDASALYRHHTMALEDKHIKPDDLLSNPESPAFSALRSSDDIHPHTFLDILSLEEGCMFTAMLRAYAETNASRAWHHSEMFPQSMTVTAQGASRWQGLNM